MVISETHQFIFYSVPKTGSSSIEQALAPYRSELTDQFNRHATCLKTRRDLPTEIWQNYFKFAFVRNPYDRMLSWYFYRKRDQLRDPLNPRHHLYTGNYSFEEFVASFTDKELMFKQVDFIAPHGGGLLVDVVGRFENLQADFSKICARIGLPARTLPRVRTSRKPARDLDTLWTAASRKIVNDYFREDFELFAYPLLE